jgi:hypothetical protein
LVFYFEEISELAKQKNGKKILMLKKYLLEECKLCDHHQTKKEREREALMPILFLILF